MVRVLKSYSSAPKISSSEIREPHERNELIWQTKMHQIAIDFTSTFIGHVVILEFDKLLWTLEKTAQWIPSSKTDAKEPVDLIRPLPWILFLPTLVALRYTLVILSLLSICLGYDVIEVSTMLEWLHQWRQVLRDTMQEAQLNAAIQALKIENTPTNYFKRFILSLLSIVKSLVVSAPRPSAVQNNKTSLDSSTVNESSCESKKQNDEISSNSSDIDSTPADTDKDHLYEDFLSRTIASSDADDEDYVEDDLNADDSSDMASHSSIASDDLLNDEIDENRSLDGEASTASKPLDNNVNDTSVANDRDDKAETTDNQNNAAVADANIRSDDALNNLFDKTLAITGNKSVTENRGKNIKRHHKSGGRSHAKSQNNGKKFNCGQMQSESNSSSNTQIDTAREFMDTETAVDAAATVAADHHTD